MENVKKRITVTISPEEEAEMKTVKKERFEEKSNSELIRYLIQKGLEVSDIRY